MKKQFQSKSVPRGTRTIWRYLGALFILFTFAIGNVWGADFTLYGNSSAPSLPLTQDGITISGSSLGSKNGSNQCSGISGIPSTKIYMVSFASGGMMNIDAGDGYKITSISMVVGRNSSGSTVSQFGHGGFSTDNSTFSEVSALSAKGYDKGTTINITPENSYRYYSFGRGKLNNTSPSSNTEFRIYQISVTREATGSGGGGQEASEAPTINTQPSTSAAQYFIGATAAELSVAATGSGTLTYQWYSNTTASNAGGTVLENCTTATYTPSTAALGTLYYYCAVTNTETGKSATTVKSNVSGAIKVVAAPQGKVDQQLATGEVAWDASVILSDDNTNITSLTALSQHGTATASGNGNTSNGGQTSKIATASGDFNDANYLELAFTIKSGMEFDVTSVTIPVQPVKSNTNNFKAILSDGTTNIEGSKSNITNGTQSNITFSSYGTLSGSVTLKIYAWGWGDGYRLGKNIVIDGTIKEAGACTTPTIAWDGNQPADAYVSDGSKTFKVTSNYTNGIDLELSSNSCGATIAAKAGSDKKQWIVSFTQAGSVTITPKVTGDGTTICAGPVSAEAKTLTVVLAHDVTFNMNGHGAAIAKQVVVDGAKAAAPYVADVDGWVFGGWYTDAECTAGNEFDFANTTINAATPLYAKWTEDACKDSRQSLSKVVLTSASAGSVTGYNGGEYAGTAVIGGMDGTKTAEVDASHEGNETGYKMNSKGSAIVFATLKKGAFQEGDKVTVTITYKNDVREINGTKNLITLYYGSSKDDATELTTLYDVSAAGSYTYRLTAADVTAIGENKGIGVFRPSSNGQNLFVYSVEITGCRPFAVTHDVVFNMLSHGTQVTKQTLEVGSKVTEPEEPEAEGWLFGGWYKENTLTNKWDFSTDVMPDNDITLFAKWTEDPCTDRQSLSKVVLTDYENGTVTGYNSDEYAGEAIIASLDDEPEDADIIGDEAKEHGYKLSSSGKSIVMATLKKGAFQAGDKVTVGITKINDSRTVDASKAIITIYAGSDKDHMMEVGTLKNVNAAGFYTYRLTAANAEAINEAGYKSIGLFRASSNGQNHYVYSVEITGCREWSVFHTLTFAKEDETEIAAKQLAEGAYASTVAPKAPRVSAHSFKGWSETKNGSVVNMDEYTITTDKTLYAVYEENDCSGNGLMFSQVAKANELAEDYSLSGTTEESIGEYATVTGGEVYLNNNSSNTRVKIAKTTSVIQLTNGDEGYIHVLLDCPLKAKDSIKVDNTNKWVIAHNASKTDKASLASSVHFFIVPAEWEGKDEFYIWRDGSSCNISTIQVIRPVLYTVSFDVMEHGNAIAAMTGVPENSKIVAPATPTDEDYSFGGWYKENTLENEWNFASDVVDDDITLFAKWIDKSDATLKTLRYGDTEIALEAGEFTYNVNLSPLATTVPALTAVTSNPNATAQVNNAAALDGEGHATSTVVVTPEVGAAKTYTVNFTKVQLYTELVDVTGHTEWSWVGLSTQEIDKANEIGTILANYVIGNHFEKIEGKADEYASRNTDGGVYQGTYLKFHTTVPGAVTVTYRGTGNSSNVTLTIGTEQLETYAGGFTDSKKVIVPAGDVKITSEGTMRVQKIVFQTLDEVTPDYSRPVTIDRMGTVCVDHNVPVGCFIGAEVYRLLYWKYGTSYADCLMVDFEEVDEMEAGNPYLIIPTEETFKLYYGGVVDATPNEVNHFIGTYNPIAQGTEGDAILMGKYGVVNNQIRLLGSGAYSPANRAYIDLANLQSKEEYEAANPSNPAPKKRISLSREGAAVATGLDAINVDTETVQKVMIDGQMYIIRGGHIFTVSGNLVK